MKSKRIENIIEEALKEKMIDGLDTDGDAYFTLETVLDAFKAGIAIGCQSVGSVTNSIKEEEEC